MATRQQCAKCPWKVSTDPRDIPNGYCERRHAELEQTIAPGLRGLGRPMRMMACHEAKPGAEIPCVGWLANQLGPGNNIALRLRVLGDRSLGEFELDGPQHETFERTLPRRRRKARG